MTKHIFGASTAAVLLLIVLCSPAWSWNQEGGQPLYAQVQQTDQGVQPQTATGNARTRQANPFSTALSLAFLVMVGVVAYRMFFSRSRGGGNDNAQGRPPVDLDAERRKRQSGAGKDPAAPSGQDELYRRARMMWEHLQDEGPAGPEGPKRAPTDSAQSPSGSAVPPGGDSSPAPGMDETEFVEGAKLAYHRLTEAFDKGDPRLAEPFASDEILEAMRRRVSSPDRETEIVLVNAKVLDVKNEGADTEARVFYDVLLRRDPSRGEPEQVRQVWTFRREGAGGTWKLSAMEEVND